MFVLQAWVGNLTFMEQSVLIASVRGPDGIRKDHVAKLLLRWLRRCFLLSAFDRKVLRSPCEQGGGSFTGPSLPGGEYDWRHEMDKLVKDYLKTVDELPHHFQLHFMHAAEILGYRHPERNTREWWYSTYLFLVNDMHLQPETIEHMSSRLGDSEKDWRAAEVVVVDQPSTEAKIDLHTIRKNMEY
jgi:hypothetical protein